MSDRVGHGSLSADTLRSLRMDAQENPFSRFFDQDGPQHAVDELVALQTLANPPGTRPMVDDAAPPDSATPAGFTFLGQFIDHDITLTMPRQQPAPPLEQIASRHQFFNARSATLDLDSVFGFGPEHDLDNGGVLYRPDFMLKTGPDTGNAAWDLARDGQGRALIGDPRNDENVILAGIHASFVHAYNRMHAAERGTKTERYIAARMRLYHTYQYIVLNDYVRRFVPNEVFKDVMQKGAPLYSAMMRREGRAQALMPIEFSVAAFRFGHSQVRPGYLMNRGPNAGAATFPVPPGVPGQPPSEGLNGGRPIPENLVFNHALFFHDGQPLPQPFNSARRIDTKLSLPLFFLRSPGIPQSDVGTTPDGNQQLARRNLLRGRQFRLVDGQTAARLAGEEALRADQIALASPTMTASTPLWFYLLKEAEVAGGEKLGRLGGRLLAETFLGILLHSQNSFLRLKPQNWTPPDGLTTAAKLMAFANLPVPAGR
jgi:hypothetical protein